MTPKPITLTKPERRPEIAAGDSAEIPPAHVAAASPPGDDLLPLRDLAESSEARALQTLIQAVANRLWRAHGEVSVLDLTLDRLEELRVVTAGVVSLAYLDGLADAHGVNSLLTLDLPREEGEEAPSPEERAAAAREHAETASGNFARLMQAVASTRAEALQTAALESASSLGALERFTPDVIATIAPHIDAPLGTLIERLAHVPLNPDAVRERTERTVEALLAAVVHLDAQTDPPDAPVPERNTT